METMAALFTRTDYARLPEGFPAQLVAGELVREPAPTYGHQYVQRRLLTLLDRLVPGDRLVFAPADVGIDDFNVFQPDIVVLRDLPPVTSSDVGIPLVAIEILSPGTASRDRGHKRRLLLAAGVLEVWLIDPAAKTVEVHTADGVRTASGSTPLASRAVPGFEVVPDVLFAPPR